MVIIFKRYLNQCLYTLYHIICILLYFNINIPKIGLKKYIYFIGYVTKSIFLFCKKICVSFHMDLYLVPNSSSYNGYIRGNL